MRAKLIETDYLVVGCGAAGIAFTDALIADSDSTVVMVDRRHAPGGHWLDAYPFVRLHQPSAYYGANSLPLGSETIDRSGTNKGLYERASGPEICAYFDRVMQQVLLPTGRVQYFPMCEYLGEGRFVSRVSGEHREVRVRRKRVDARYLEPAVPATTKPPFEVAGDAWCVPVNELVRVAAGADAYTIIGAGKTAMDASLWLLEVGVSPEAIHWIKPSESWLLNRAFVQGGELVGQLFEGISLQVEAAAQARSTEDLFARLSASAQLLQVDESTTPTTFRGATVSALELDQLRSIRNVVQRGHVRRLERERIVFDDGAITTRLRTLHVHCAATGLNPAPAVPIFDDHQITLQPIRTGLIPFNAAVVGFVEATYEDTATKNRLCPTNRLPNAATDWIRGTLTGLNADYLWSKEPAISHWLDGARLNPTRGVRQRMGEPEVQRAGQRYTENIRPALANLHKLSLQTAG